MTTCRGRNSAPSSQAYRRPWTSRLAFGREMRVRAPYVRSLLLAIGVAVCPIATPHPRSLSSATTGAWSGSGNLTCVAKAIDSWWSGSLWVSGLR